MSSAKSEKRWYVRSFGMACAAVVVTLNVTLSVSKKRAAMVVKEPDRLLAPDAAISDVHVASASVCGFPSLSPGRSC